MQKRSRGRSLPSFPTTFSRPAYHRHGPERGIRRTPMGMRIITTPPGTGGHSTVSAIVEPFKQAEADGFQSAWIGNHLNYDAMTVCALAGQATSTIELGTAVVPTYPRHPMVMAQQALTTNVACGGRFTLGIGLSHKFIVEGWQGLRWATPVRHMREYLEVLNPLLDGELVNHKGQEYQVQLNNAPFTQLNVPGGGRPQVVVAALGPGMLKVTGELADGTSMFHCGPNYIEQTAVPTITKAAESVGRVAPRIIAGIPISVTDKEEAARTSAGKGWEG
ncbi:MAG TPA: hypothetical protein DGL25_00880, partial [Dehalococcoidia bacterium]|nr:hypothetical protein [Dehalococcoidia bacterium]